MLSLNIKNYIFNGKDKLLELHLLPAMSYVQEDIDSVHSHPEDENQESSPSTREWASHARLLKKKKRVTMFKSALLIVFYQFILND
jgi:hypothetical protein